MTGTTMLLRQVNPSFVQQGKVTSQVFRPTPKDEKKLSVYDGDLISPKAAWTHFTEILGYKSVGVLAVTVGECEQESLPVVSDPNVFREHAIIDFCGNTESEIMSKAKRLKGCAIARGWQYKPE